MNPLIQLKQTAPVFLVTFLLVCFGVLPRAQAVITDPEDYFPNGTTGAGQGALLNLTEGQFNTAIGLLSLFSVLDGGFNTGVGQANAANGWNALASNTVGNDNTAVG